MANTAHERLLNACYAFLVPIVRILLRKGISYREFDQLLRSAFVRVAAEEYGIRGRPTNTSRISAMTGVPRKEVRRIKELIEEYDSPPRAELSPLGDVLHRWYTDAVYLDADGSPIRLAPEGLAPSFEALVKTCIGDLPPGAVKVELIRIGAVRKDEDGRLRVLRRQAVPASIDDRLLTSLSFNLYGLASTIAYNSNPERNAPGRIERFVQSEHIPPETRSQVRTIVRGEIETFTNGLDDMFSNLETTSNTGKQRVGVGVYYYEDEED